MYYKYAFREPTDAVDRHVRTCIVTASTLDVAERAFRRKHPNAERVEAFPMDEEIIHGTDHYVVIVHKATGHRWSLNRNYYPNADATDLDKIDLSKAVEEWDGHTTLPSYLKEMGIPSDQFKSYWMY